MTHEPFSFRMGLRPDTELVFEDAPPSVRVGLIEVLEDIGFRGAATQRWYICKALRIAPDDGNWSDRNVESEVNKLLGDLEWFQFFDVVERLPKFFPEGARAAYHGQVPAYYSRVNRLFAEERVGWHFVDGQLERVGSNEFESAAAAARVSLSARGLVEPLRQFERALAMRNARPPDSNNAIKEAVNSLEGTVQVLTGRQESLSLLVSEEISPKVPSAIAQIFKALYSLGSGTVGARHASVGGNDATPGRAEVAIHVAAALHALLLSEVFPAP